MHNKDKADELQLTKEERFAYIAHELGHLFDNPREEGENQQDREIRADNFAVKLKLTVHQITALEKFKNGQDDVNIQARIDILRNSL